MVHKYYLKDSNVIFITFADLTQDIPQDPKAEDAKFSTFYF